MGGRTILRQLSAVNGCSRYDNPKVGSTTAKLRVLLAAVVIFAACGGHPPQPKRGVVEADLGAWKFSRFQPVLDVEVMIEGNRGEGFTASYASDAALKKGHISDKDVVNVFVTRYERDDGIVRATVKL